MEIDLKRNEIRCECGALIFDGLIHKSFLVETIDGELVCPKCGAEETIIRLWRNES